MKTLSLPSIKQAFRVFLFLWGSTIAQANTLISNAYIYSDQLGKFVDNQHLVIQNGKIISITDQPDPLSSGDDIEVVDATGQFLVPGLIEMHGHLPTREFQGAEVDDLLALFVLHGVTTVRGVLGGPTQLQLLKRVQTSNLIAPDLVLAGPGFSGGNTPSPLNAIQRVNQYADEGWKMIKVFDGLSKETYDAIISTANKRGLPVLGHVPRAVGLEHALSSGQHTIEHLDGYLEGGPGEYRLLTEDELVLLADKTREAGVGVVPTMKVWEVILKAADPQELLETKGLEYVKPATLKKWQTGYQTSYQNRAKRLIKKILGEYDVDILVQNRRNLLAAMAARDVAIYFGTDSPQTYSVAGASVTAEMLEMRRSGMTSRQVLESATVRAGNLLAPYFTTGKIEAGYEADLVLLNANPLENLAAFDEIAGVFSNGHHLDATVIQQKLAEIKTRARLNYQH